MRVQDDEAQAQAQYWISEFKGIEKLAEQLQFILVLLYSQPEEIKNLFEAEILKFEKIWGDIKFMREVKHRDSLVNDYPSEYFGMDYGEDDPFKFKEDVEKRINKLSLEIMGVLGRIIKSTSTLGIIIGDDV